MAEKKEKAEPKAEEPKVEEKKVTADPTGDIDQRMAALLKDHQAMGSRPK